ncbi:MAG: hypothetical protein RDA78_00880 [Roseibium sp.]|uniref:hypothetical protein n=1 Tax=Roseibium sp. TaxID=1936156 RepID=UPI003D9C6583
MDLFKNSFEVLPGWQRSTEKLDAEILVISASAADPAVQMKTRAKQPKKTQR